MMRIDSSAALTLAALIRSALEVIARIENHVSQFDADTLSPAELDSLAYSMHNIYNALENCFEQISRGFEDHQGDQARWHRELLDTMFLEINCCALLYYRRKHGHCLESCLAFGTCFVTHTISNSTKRK